MGIGIFPFLLAALVGFRHAFETDHLVAVGNIVSKRNSVLLAMKDGTYWGLGHSSSLLVIGVLMVSLRYAIPANYFQSMEGAVGVMIILLGLFRLWQFFKSRPANVLTHDTIRISEEDAPPQTNAEPVGVGQNLHLHKVSYGIGIIHGLAGSGVLIAAAMAAMKTVGTSLLFLVIFSAGCMVGMAVAAGVLGLPFAKKLQSFASVQQALVVASCIVCILLGGKIMMENWM